MTQILVAHYSTYGTNAAMARTAAEALTKAGYTVVERRFAETVPDAIVQAQAPWADAAAAQAHIPVLTGEDIVAADGIIFSMPTRFGAAPVQVRALFDSLGGLWGSGKLANKAISAMTSAANAHGGQEATLLGLYTSLMHWGAILVPPGFTDDSISGAGGNPYGFSRTAAGPLTEVEKEAIAAQAVRTAKVAAAIKGTL